MDQVTSQMLSKIKREIETHQNKITKLHELETSIINQFANSGNGTSDMVTANDVRTRRTAPLNGVPRKVTIHEWLKKHGPATRVQIIKGTRLPDGTVGAYLSVEKDLFQKREDGWHAL